MTEKINVFLLGENKAKPLGNRLFINLKNNIFFRAKNIIFLPQKSTKN